MEQRDGSNVTDDEVSPSIRLVYQMQQEELTSHLQQPDFGAEDLDDETRQSLELAWRLQEEERIRMQEQAEAAERLQNEPEDAESIALAIRLQQEDDESALRNALGLQGEDGDEPVSPSQYSYEQLMRLQDTVGMVSKGASSEDISSLTRVLTVRDSRADNSVILGEQCSICRMEFEDDDELRVLKCGHAEHTECLDQWLCINKCCPLCQCEVLVSPSPKACEPCETSPLVASDVLGMSTSGNVQDTPAPAPACISSPA